MQQIPDWAELWRQIVREHEKGRSCHAHDNDNPDMWINKARGFHENAKKRWNQPDSSRDFIIELLKANPGSTLLDIGAGTGSWVCQLAPYAAKITALEPSPAMLEVMEEAVRELGLTNVEIIKGSWPEYDVEPHDFTLCSHAMYGSDDAVNFFGKMHACTRKTCLVLMRAPTHDGVMAQIARHVWGQPYDSPNFQIGYNTLLQMGLFPNVRFEKRGLWDPWTNDSLEDAVKDVKSRLGLSCDYRHDEFIQNTLRANLGEEKEKWVWPRGVCSALVYWNKIA